MAERDAWSFATFHTAVLVAAGVSVLHLTGTLGDALAGLDTATGLVVYAALWATTWATNRRVLAAAAPDGPVGSLLLAGSVWGAVTAAAFVLELVALLGVSRVLGGDVAVTRIPLSLLGVLVIVLAVAGIVGGVVGAVLALVDAGAARAARALVA